MRIKRWDSPGINGLARFRHRLFYQAPQRLRQRFQRRISSLKACCENPCELTARERFGRGFCYRALSSCLAFRRQAVLPCSGENDVFIAITRQASFGSVMLNQLPELSFMIASIP